MGRNWEERVAEYVDSPDLEHRFRDGKTVVVFIRGNYGTYRVEADPKRERGACTCPSEIVPCKHVAAVLETWKRNPDSFQDPGELLVLAFEGKDRDEILAALRAVVMEHPSVLGALRGEAEQEYYVEEEEGDEW